MFFRELNLRWKYEPTTLRGKGFVYTPDFEISGLGYIEIKPSLELFIEETEKRLKKAAVSNPNVKFFVFCASHVEFSRVALYEGNKIYAPTVQQMHDLLSSIRQGSDRFSKDALESDIKRAAAIANTKRFSEWQSPKEILVDVLESLSIQ